MWETFCDGISSKIISESFPEENINWLSFMVDALFNHEAQQLLQYS